MKKVLFGVLGLLVVIPVVFAVTVVVQVERGRDRVQGEIKSKSFPKISPFDSVKKLSILPLVEYYGEGKDIKTEPGVSYLIKADDAVILMDTGNNEKKEHPSPLIANMQKLGVRPEDIGMIFITHLHMDHLGGNDEYSDHTFSLSRGPVKLNPVTAYAPAEVSPSKWNPGPKIEVIKEPRVLRPGIASIGPIPRYLFLMGYTEEQSLAINVEGKGIVLIIGCGHQTIERIVERARMIFREPIYAVIGGLHYPVNGGRIFAGPVNVQRLVGSDTPPWKGLGEDDVRKGIEALKAVNPAIVSLSPHDSSDWSLEQFRKSFGNKFIELKAGSEITL
jgi:7,8-dihydropterin-6-yl-methyl-4-(beta-D-ribofuranosyl)aminobenzene 5'-phosphate synthase